MNRALPFASDRGVSRRAFLKFCALTASLLALPPGAAVILAESLSRARRLPVVWLSFQECTGCTESLTRSSAPSIERLLFELISLDYHHTLQAAAGAAAEQARDAVIKEYAGRFLLVVDGSGAARASFLGPVTATDLWATVAELREPGTLPAEGCDHGVAEPAGREDRA